MFESWNLIKTGTEIAEYDSQLDILDLPYLNFLLKLDNTS